METTRKHPRSMREAFRDADYASSVERTRVNGHRAVNWALALGSVAIFFVLIGVM
jgi:hypothetical protein